ncbi:hypothetical protein DFH09DRAFT_1092520 [Mycena vulgaris]|nr:hypothetical protein DFH09DRAFT_1092520 [Mycena vulgaris]
MSILYLAVELVQGIADQVNMVFQDSRAYSSTDTNMISWNNKRLWATCHTLNLAVAPLVLARLVVDLFEPRITRTIGQLESLTNPAYLAFSFFRNMVVLDFPLNTGNEDNKPATSMWLCLRTYGDIIRPSYLRSVQSVIHQVSNSTPSCRNASTGCRCHIDSDGSIPAEGYIVEGLHRLPPMLAIELIMPESRQHAIPFDRLRNLRSLSVDIPPMQTNWNDILRPIIEALAEAVAKSPELESLTIIHKVDYPYRDEVAHPADGEYPCFQYLLAKVEKGVHLLLRRLTLHNDDLLLGEYTELVSLISKSRPSGLNRRPE